MQFLKVVLLITTSKSNKRTGHRHVYTNMSQQQQQQPIVRIRVCFPCYPLVNRPHNISLHSRQQQCNSCCCCCWWFFVSNDIPSALSKQTRALVFFFNIFIRIEKSIKRRRETAGAGHITGQRRPHERDERERERERAISARCTCPPP